MNNKSQAHNLGKYYIPGTILLILVMLFGFRISIVQASSWNIRSQGDCYSGYPRGDSWLNWSGYSSSAQGWTNGKLWYWNGSQWLKMAEGGATDIGSSGNALVHNEASYRRGSWDETGVHWSNFFSGTKYSDANNWTCP